MLLGPEPLKKKSKTLQVWIQIPIKSLKQTRENAVVIKPRQNNATMKVRTWIMGTMPNFYEPFVCDYSFR